MKNITIQVGDYDHKLIQEIFENEKDFQPRDEKDKMIISVMRQIAEYEEPENPKG